MRRIRYQVAMSLDGYIADSAGGYDWIPQDPEIDFAALFAQFDTVLLGRKTYEVMAHAGHLETQAAMKTFVISTTLSPEGHPGVTILGEGCQCQVESLRQMPGKDIWLFGGGELFRSLLAANLVDTMELAIVPVVLGGGLPMAPPPIPTTKLKLTKHQVYNQSGIVLLEYEVAAGGPA